MKYLIDCPKCGRAYEVESEFAPVFCLKCGFDLPRVESLKRGEIDYDKIDAMVAELDAEIVALKEETEAEIARIRAEAKVRETELRERRAKLKSKVRWRDYAKENYVHVDHSADKAMKMFGKRLKDLTPEELREYNRHCTRMSRERRKKENNDG